MLSNIFMIDFDIELKKLADSLGGIYRRYSDDILFICSPEYEQKVEEEIMRLVSDPDINLKINPSKTEYTRFKRISKSELICSRKRPDNTWASGAVQYLGLSFDGKKKSLRHSTIARYQRKVKYAVRNARRTAEHFKKDKIHSKALYLDLTDIGSQSMPSYAKRVSSITGDKSAFKQVNTHKRKLGELIKAQNELLEKRKNK